MVGRPPPYYDEGVRALERFLETEIVAMKKEWPKFVRQCHDLPVRPDDRDPTKIMERSSVFWREARIDYPNLARLARLAFTVTPSSAAAERVFSLLKNFFT